MNKKNLAWYLAVDVKKRKRKEKKWHVKSNVIHAKEELMNVFKRSEHYVGSANDWERCLMYERKKKLNQ